jgi:hypothetical protein
MMDGVLLTRIEARARHGRRIAAVLARWESVRVQRLTLAAAVVLVTPALATGFCADDYLLTYQVTETTSNEWAGRGPFELFRWVDPAHMPRLKDGNGLAWWAYEDTLIAFMRPVTSLTHALDIALWPGSHLAMHLHSLLWFVLLLAVASRTYAELLNSRRAAGIASAIFALDSWHGVSIGWISNRNALIAGVFGCGALLFHHRARCHANLLNALAAAGCLALALFAGELGSGAVAYLVTYALFLERGALARRLRSLAPYAVVLAAWAIARSVGQYGVYGLGGYIDPMHEPLAFARVLPERFAMLVASQIWRFSADVQLLAPAHLRPLVLACALALGTLACWLAWPCLKAQRALRFWACAALASTLPLTAALPSDRLLTLAGFGMAPAVALVVIDALGGTAALRARLATALVGLHLVLGPLSLPLMAFSPAYLASWTKSVDAGLPGDSGVREQTVIVVQIPNSILLTYLPATRSVEHRPRPRGLLWLMASTGDPLIERRRENTLRVTAPAGVFDSSWDERSPRQPLRRGERIELRDMTAIVIDVTADGRPNVCDFEFAAPLESPSYVWLTWQTDKLVPFRVPPWTAGG